MKDIIACLWVFISGLTATAQIETPVKWAFAAKNAGEGKAEINIRADMQPGWHVYSQFIEEGGPIPTSFRFAPSDDYNLIGKVTESPEAVSSFDKNFNMQIAWHEKQVTFKQQIKVYKTTSIKGILEFMVCNDEKCLPPEEVSFNIPVFVKPTQPVSRTASLIADTSLKRIIDFSGSQTDTLNKSEQTKNTTAEKIMYQPENKKDDTLADIFIVGFIGGLLAFFMPCIYPMIPLTVSFFTKRAGSKSKGIQSASIYGISIIVIYVSLGLLITAVFGASALNEAASSAAFNLIFFAVLIIFGISFLGAFEITLPSALVNTMDDRSNRGGLTGLFFMAFTLALVSFSCTGPIIGTLLVEAVSKGSYLGPAIGMLGFSAALALPFTLFAIFPSWLKELPKSGGWMNTVKVSLGFLELALAFKFLSNVDLAYHWNILDRDIFLVIWIVIFGVWGLYLLGKFKLAHDVEIGFISLTRLFFAMLVSGFTLYMIPGLWGAPLKSLSGWLPPIGTQDFNLYNASVGTTITKVPKKYQGLFHPSHPIDAFYDYEEGLAYAKKVNKPALIDFTGHSCANCRRMEASVWTDQEVSRRLNNDYVLISLYVDDRTELAENEKYVSESGKKIKTLGHKWSDLQTRLFKTNSQPYYVVVNHEGKILVPPQAFNLNVKNYINFLDNGKEAFSRQ